MKRLTADLRMYRHSGIGRYLRNVMPLLLPLLEVDRLRVLARRKTLGEAAWLADPRIDFMETRAGIYSLGEQSLALEGAYRETDLLWVPHFNAPLLYRGRMVMTVHDVAPLAMPEILGNAAKRAYAKLLITRSVARAEAILCVSAFTAREVERLLQVSPGKLTVTYPGLDAAWPSHAEPHVEADQAPYLLFVGNVKPNKNLSLLLRAFARVAGTVPYRLVVAGRKSGFSTGDAAVLRQAEALGDRVRLTDEIPDAELIALYAGAVGLCLPSLYEGFGLPVLEAMALGCPVLCSTAGSLPEVAGDAALYFDPRDENALAECLLRIGDQGVTGPLIAAGRVRAGHFTFERCAYQTAAVMNRILSESD